MSPFSISVASAVVLHLGLAGVVVTMRGAHGHGRMPAQAPIDVAVVNDAPVPEETFTDAPKPEPTPVVSRVARGTPSPASVVAIPITSADPLTDVVPEPPPSEPPRFSMSLGPQGGASASAQQPVAPPSDDLLTEADVSERARKLGGAPPKYPAGALADGIELDAPLAFEIVVDTGGRVERVRPIGHAGHGFDEAAIAALRTYRFSPAMRDGHAVRVRMRWTVDFRLN